MDLPCQAAASASHRSLNDFLMESALSKAEEILADRRIFKLGQEKWVRRNGRSFKRLLMHQRDPFQD